MSVISTGSSIFAYGGDGSDGALVFDGSSVVLGITPSANAYTLTRDVFATSLTVNNGVTVNTGGAAIFCTGTFTNNGTVQNNGGNGNNGTNSGGSTAIAGGAGGSPTGTADITRRLVVIMVALAARDQLLSERRALPGKIVLLVMLH